MDIGCKKCRAGSFKKQVGSGARAGSSLHYRSKPGVWPAANLEGMQTLMLQELTQRCSLQVSYRECTARQWPIVRLRVRVSKTIHCNTMANCKRKRRQSK